MGVIKDNLMDGYGVDMVICIDVTGSMAPIIEKVKENALAFYEKREL